MKSSTIVAATRGRKKALETVLAENISLSQRAVVFMVSRIRIEKDVKSEDGLFFRTNIRTIRRLRPPGSAYRYVARAVILSGLRKQNSEGIPTW
ncbi:MAG: hypothetical protein H6981_02290 [Gammaproteobacteria bacterium]|nr:hypothetical protein [Gammaproteobacteria bacterium]MCP5135619.1 hypothetical protein [Gammaproteobacteria bacterium]